MAKGFTVELKGAKKGGNGMVYALGAVGTAFAVDYWLSNRDSDKLTAAGKWQKAIERVIQRKREASHNWDRTLELAGERIAAHKAAKAQRARERWHKAIRDVMYRRRRASRNWDNALRRARNQLDAERRAADEARRLAALKAEQERIAAEQAAERERIQAEKEHLAREAGKVRFEAAKARRAQQAALKAERKRFEDESRAEAARFQAERERMTRESLAAVEHMRKQAEADRKAVEAQRKAAEADRKRLAAEAAAEAARLQAERERLTAEADALREERLSREEAARKAAEEAAARKEAERKAALARKRWQDAIRKVRSYLEAQKRRDSAARKWRRVAAGLRKSQQDKSSLARQRWAEAIEAVKNANAQERALKKFFERMREMAIFLFKLFVVVALAMFLYSGEQEEIQDRIPTLGEGGVVYESYQPPAALGYVEAPTYPIAVGEEPQQPQTNTKTSGSTQIASIERNLDQEGDWWFIVMLVCGTLVM